MNFKSLFIVISTLTIIQTLPSAHAAPRKASALNINQLRSGQTNYKFTETAAGKVWSDNNGNIFVEANNAVQPLTINMLRSGKTDFKFSESSGKKIWTNHKTGMTFLEENNQLRILSSSGKTGARTGDQARRIVTNVSWGGTAGYKSTSGNYNAPDGGVITPGVSYGGIMPIVQGWSQGQNPAMDGYELKRMILGVASDDKSLAALILATCAVESGGGQVGMMMWGNPIGRPTREDQNSRRDSAGINKMGSDSQEVSMYRMNVAMLKELSQDRGEFSNLGQIMSSMDRGTPEGDRLATIYMKQAYQKYGRKGALIYHRQGKHWYDLWKQNGSFNDDNIEKDQQDFESAYNTVQRSIIYNDLLRPDNNQLPWLQKSAPIK